MYIILLVHHLKEVKQEKVVYLKLKMDGTVLRFSPVAAIFPSRRGKSVSDAGSEVYGWTNEGAEYMRRVDEMRRRALISLIFSPMFYLDVDLSADMNSMLNSLSNGSSSSVYCKVK